MKGMTKMKFYEKERSPAESYMVKELSHNLNFPRHMHSSFEFIDVLEGELIISLSDSDQEYVLDKSKAALILPYQVHSYRTEVSSKYILSIFSSDYVSMFYEKIKDKTASSPIFDFEDNTVAQKFLETDDFLMECSYLYEICSMYCRQQVFTEQQRINVNLIGRIIEYIENNYTENISLRTIAEECNYSYHYLSNFFNSNIGINFKRFLNEYRIHHACSLLRDTAFSISDIAHQSGYDNLRSFNREFLSITGTTPSEYKHRLEQIGTK